MGKNGSCDVLECLAYIKYTTLSCKQKVLYISYIHIMGLKGGQFAYKHALHNCSSLDVRVQDVARKLQ